MLVAENVKALRKLLPVLEAEYGKAGYKCHAQLFNSKYWGVPQNRERYIVVGTLDSLPDTYTYPEEQHDYVPKLSTILEADVDDTYGYPTERERERESRKRIYTEVAPTLRSSRQGVKVVENTTKSDTEKTPPCSR